MEKNTEEYQFEGDSEYTDNENFEAPTQVQRPASQAGAASRPKLPFNLPVKNRKIIIIIGIFAFLFFIVQIVKLFSSKPKEKIEEQTIVTGVSSGAQKVDLQSSGISALNEKYIAEEAKIQQLQNDLDGAKANIAVVGKAVQDLNIVVQQLNVEVQKMVTQKTALSETMKGKKTPYHIRAMVNGRAWLEAGSGVNIITVRLGTSLGKYGKVNEIDDKNGIVTTDKGAIIEYGKNDI